MTKNSKRMLTYAYQDMVQVLIYVEKMLISLDKLGSYYGSQGNEYMEKHGRKEYEKELARYIVECDVTGRLAKIRCILSSPFDSTLGDDDMDELERELYNIKLWRKPGDNDFD